MRPIKTKPYQNFSLENIVQEIEGVIYTEEWKDIVGYEGYYKISTFGRIKSMARTIIKGKRGNQKIKQDDKILVQGFNQKGYLLCGLCINSIVKRVAVHRLVGKAFIPNPENKPQINHKKGVKTDNHYSQIEWNTGSENQLHSISIGLRTIQRGANHALYGRKRPEELKRKGADNNKSKLVLDMLTGIFYDCLKDACSAKNLEYKITSSRLTGKRLNKTSLIYA